MTRPFMFLPGAAVRMKTLLCSSIVVMVLARPTAAATEEALLRGIVRDAATGRPTSCTVAIVDANGRLAIERESFKGGFRSDGRFEKHLPAGRTRIRVTRGIETRTVEKEVQLRAGEVTEVELALERIVRLRQRGWYGGDSHVHMLHGERTVPVDFDFVALTAQAEDLQYLSLAHAWQMEDATPEALETELKKRSTPDCVVTWNLEAPKNYYKGDAGRCLGHCWNVAMRGRTAEGLDVIKLLLAASAWDYESAKPSYANFESHRLVHEQGGTVFYSHPLRWWTGPWGGQGGYPKMEKMRVSNMAVELPLDTLIGPTYDGLDVMTSAGEFAANTKAFELWAMLLNRGYRLAATASSDACFDRPGGAVPGAVRTYTYLEGGFSLPAVARATAEGKTFVTSGPLVLATIEGQPPGSTFRANGQPHTLKVEAWASGSDTGGLRRLEILRNGAAFQTFDLVPPASSCQTNIPLQPQESAWFCVRVLGLDLQKQRAVTGAFFFDEKPHQPPPAVAARVQVRITDAKTGALLDSSLTEILCAGTLPREGVKRPLAGGEGTLVVPGTVRLRAEAPGYAALTLSPFLDNPVLVETITRLEAADLLKWQTYERIRQLLEDARLTFALEKRGR